MHQFNEHHAAFDGFSPFYFQVIGPRLRNREVDRKAAVKKTLWTLSLTPLLALICIFLSPFDWQTEVIGIWASTLFFIPLYVAYTIIYTQRSISTVTKQSIIGGFCRFKKWTYLHDKRLEKSAHNSHGLMNFVDLGFAPKYNSATIEGHVTGKINGSYFQFFRATFSRAEETVYEFCPWKYRFKGQFVSILFPQKFQAQTVVIPDKGLFNWKKRRGMKRVRLVDPVFEKMFEVYGTDQVEARYLLAPDFMQRLVDLEHAFKGKSIRFGFTENQLLIAIETRLKLGVGSMFKQLDDPKRTQNVLDALSAIYDVVDGVTTKQERILVNAKSTAA